jgi:hypothetical protein
MGRPSKKSSEVVAEIGRRLGQGEPLTAICVDLGVCDDTVRNWMEGDEEVSRAIARAREEGEQALAFRARQTARGKGPDAGGDSTGDVQRDKLIIDTDMKLLAKFNPRRWGDKIDHNHAGSVTYVIETGVEGGLDGGAD